MLGWREWVGLPEIQRAPVLAKIDTGAWSNTLHAADIEIIESVPESRIRFKLEEEGKWFERPIDKWRRIRDTGGHETLRPVIRTTIEIASRDFDVEMCLADRSQLKAQDDPGQELPQARLHSQSLEAVHSHHDQVR